MIREECSLAVVEDGGEVSAVSDRSVDVALLAGDSPLSGAFGFRIKDFPMGISTTSGRFSHALSFGDADAVTVFSGTAGLADAASTAIGNVVEGRNDRKAVKRGLAKASSIDGVEGVLILHRGMVGMTGRIPQLVKLTTEGDTTPYLEALKAHSNSARLPAPIRPLHNSYIFHVDFMLKGLGQREDSLRC
jgi:ApbE superfamily uncharacterized protein (UPF0280 family)